MRAQRDREEQTVAIASALGLFALVMAAAGLIAWWVASASDLLDGHGETYGGAAVLVAGVVAGAHLSRSGR